MAFKDSSTNNFQLTAFGNAQISTSVKKYGDGSALFDGSGDYLDLPVNAIQFNADDFTIEFWVNPTRTGSHTCVANWGCSGNMTIFLSVDIPGGVTVYLNGAGPFITGGSIQVNQWQHVALVRQGSEMKAYINGVQAGNTYNIGNTPINTIVDNIRIGRDTASFNCNQPLEGYIDDLRITKGIARYTTNFTPPQQQLPDPSDPYIDNVSLLLHMDGLSGSQIFTDSSSNNFTLSAFGNAQISTSVKKLGSGSGYFGGGTNRVTIQDNDAFTLNSAFTIEAWIYPTQFLSGIGGPYNTIISQCNNLADNSNRSWALFVFSDKAAFYYTTNGVTDNIINFTTSISLSTWTHVAASIASNGTLRMFVNGAQVGTASIPLPVFNSTADVCIGTFGKYAEDGYPELSFNGYIDDLRITKGVARYTSNFVPHTAPFVNPPPIPSGYLAFWKLADLTDSSPNGNNLVNTNNVQFVAGKIGNCAQFDGTNYLSTSNTFLLNQVTFSCWFKNTGSPSIGVGTGYPGHFRIVSIGGDVYFQTPDAVTANTTGASLNDGNWHFAAGTSNGTTSKLYIDGALVDTSSVSYSPPVAQQFSIGSYGDGLATNGTQLDAVGLWNRELTQSEIDALYNNGNGREP